MRQVRPEEDAAASRHATADGAGDGRARQGAACASWKRRRRDLRRKKEVRRPVRQVRRQCAVQSRILLSVYEIVRGISEDAVPLADREMHTPVPHSEQLQVLQQRLPQQLGQVPRRPCWRWCWRRPCCWLWWMPR